MSRLRAKIKGVDFDSLFCNGGHTFCSAEMTIPSVNGIPFRNQMVKYHYIDHKIDLMGILNHNLEYLMAMGLLLSNFCKTVAHKNCRLPCTARIGDWMNMAEHEAVNRKENAFKIYNAALNSGYKTY